LVNFLKGVGMMTVAMLFVLLYKFIIGYFFFFELPVVI